MESRNYWGICDSSQDELIYTENIYEIMEEQCKYLFKYTKGKIFSVFGEIKIDGSMFTVAKNMSNLFKGISGISGLHETIDELSTSNLIDANSMYYDKHYGFEICTDKYRFRLFELRMTPVYPIEIIVDEGICKNIGSTLSRITISSEKFNHFTIIDEEVFCNVLQEILQDTKVRYIINELLKRVPDKIEEKLPRKVIICEGHTDEIILQAIARKLNQEVIITVADGKYNVPAIFDTINQKDNKAKILIVVDSDGDESKTNKTIMQMIGTDNYTLAIINNHIEDWFMPEVTDFSKLKLLQSIDTIIEDVNLDELCNKHDSFAKILSFLQN